MLNKLSARLDQMSGGLLIFLGAALWSTASGVTKCFELDAVLLPGLRSLIAGVMLLPLLRPKQIVWNRWLWATLLSYSCLVLLLLMSVRYTTGTNALALQFTAPLWLCLYRLVFKRQLPVLRDMGPVALMGLGVVVILCEPTTGSNTLGNILGACGGMAFAAMSSFQPKAKLGGTFSGIALMNLAAALLLFVPLVLAPGYTVQVPGSAWPYILFLACIEMPVGYFLYFRGLNKVQAQQATILSTWEFILTPLWAFVLARELPTLYGMTGWVVMLLAVVLEYRLLRKHKPGPASGPGSI